MEITRPQTSALKGLAIIAIVLHNVIHAISTVRENEFSFIDNRVSNFLSSFPHSPVESLFSFYGWLGVSVFVFISGYGLSVKYGNTSFNPFRWLSRHYLRLFLLVLPCYVLYVAYLHHLEPLLPIDFHQVVTQQLLLLNLSSPISIDPGVYWYLGLALQLYAWFLLFRKLSSRWLVAIVIACWAAVTFSPAEIVFWLRHNSLGWMTEFIAGILLARHPQSPLAQKCRDAIHRVHRDQYLPCIACIALIFLCSLTPYTFTLSGIFFVLLLLPFRVPLSRSRNLLYLGHISAALYVVHPLLRRCILHYLRKFDILPSPVLAALIVLLVSILAAHCYTRLWNSRITL